MDNKKIYQYNVETNIGTASGQIEAVSKDEAEKNLKEQYDHGGTHPSVDEDGNLVDVPINVTEIELVEIK